MEGCLDWAVRNPEGIRAYIRRLARLAADLRAEHRTGAAPDRCAQNSQTAQRLLDTYGSQILRYAYALVRNRSDAEEILQDTLLQYLRTGPRLESPDHEKAWLLRVAGNLSKNRLRYNAGRQTDELREDLIAREREDLSFVWDAVRSLPERYRSVIHLYYYEGLSAAEIAAITGSRESTVRSWLNRGRARLKTILKEEYDFEPL